MSDITVNLVSDSGSETCYASRMRISLNSHLPPLDHDHLKQKVISLSEDSDSERVYGDSLQEKVSSSGSLESLLSNEGMCRQLYSAHHENHQL